MSEVHQQARVVAPSASLPARAQPLAEPERIARLRLARSGNVGPRTYAHLVGRFGGAARALEALPALAATGGRPAYEPFPQAGAETELSAGQAAGAALVTLGEADYPALLARIDYPPPVLWVKGDPAIFRRPAVALVGARNASALGLRTARSLARGLGEAGQVIVSGLARGVDAAAHEAALATGTVAVMAGGIDQIYPPENKDLAAEIAAHGALIAECAPGTEPTARHFPRRNRLVSGLARGVVLIEAAIRSGSLITARCALEQGREAMACPGAPEDPRTGGCNQMIRDGAALIRNAEDVLEALSAPRTLDLAEPGREFLFDDQMFDDDGDDDDFDEFEVDPDAGAALAEQILRLVGPHPVEMDELARQCGASPADFSLAILELDLAGQIDIHRGGLVSSVQASD